MNPAATNWQHWRLERDAGDLAWLWLDKAGSSTNTLSQEVLNELIDILVLVREQDPAGLVIGSAKHSGFIAGADVHDFSDIKTPEQARQLLSLGQTAFNRLAALPFPSLCLINGFCLGGGLELALACRYRVMVDDPGARVGLPEVRLGIHPGWGGVTRLTAHIGVPAAMNLMLSGRSLAPRQAGKLGLVDRVVPERQLRNAAGALLRELPPRSAPGALDRMWNRVLRLAVVRRLLAGYLRRQVKKRVNPEHYPAPFALIRLWEEHGAEDTSLMLKAEMDSVTELITSSTARNLVRVFMLRERLKSFGRDTEFSLGHVHVIGAGVMGGDIAAWCALQGVKVTLQDREPRFIAPAMKRARALFEKELKIPHRVTAAMDRLIPDVGGQGSVRADVVIEAIVEDLEAKQSLFQGLEPGLKPGALLATNTSSIVLGELGSVLAEPARLVGIHFFNPVARMQLVEVVQDTETDAESSRRAGAFCHRIKRLPVPVRSSPGFLVNRVLMPYLVEAMHMLEEGIPAPVVDRAARDFGMPVGPVELADSVGLDICQSVATILSQTLDIRVPDNLSRMVEQGHLGRKSGRGFYRYRRGKVQAGKADPQRYPLDEITDRLILIMLNEAMACLDEGVVEDAELLDAAMIFGTGFAPFRGGPMQYSQDRGQQQLKQRLLDLEEKFGKRFTPHNSW